MASSQESALDEIQWRSEMLAQSMGGIHTNTILPYFSQSPFFDATSNNASLTTQATYNPSMYHLLQTRAAFEGRLRSMQGLEYMVASEPPPPTGPDGETGAWVIRKQIRRRKAGTDDGSSEVEVLSTYFVVEDCIYMAPSVGNVLGTRLLSTVTSLTKFLSTASSLPTFTPAQGHTYSRPQTGPSASLLPSQSSRASKETTPLPDSLPRSNPSSLPINTNSSSASSIVEARSIVESLSLSLRHAGEYMDENPLMGEPGSFMLSSTNSQQSQHLRLPAASASTKPSIPVTPQPSGPTVAAAQGKKGGKGVAPSASPNAAVPATAKPKRRKSKAAGATSSTSPS
ncbi:MAG: Mediator of RNA polymerase II transcription subunit 6 [Sclerophora amabilis]|nr:MAG: Mediator of RNA polymerase II transcription subunit 6 [Sclerophora amabilis]